MDSPTTFNFDEQQASWTLYRDKAREMNDLAEHVIDPFVRRQFMALARGYELLAQHLVR